MKNLIEPLKDLILKSGEIALKMYDLGLSIDRKTDNSPVTNADRAISDFIYYHLQLLTPNIPVICEERDLRFTSSRRVWLIDPIDGTRNYIKGAETYTVNIALIENNEPVCGFIYQPSIKKLYYTDATRNLKIEQDGKQLSQSYDMEQKNYRAVISSAVYNLNTKYFLKKHSITDIIAIPSSIKFCLIAEGMFDIYPKFGDTMQWDTAAGHAILKSVGGSIKDTKGVELSYCLNDSFLNSNFIAFGKRISLEMQDSFLGF